MALLQKMEGLRTSAQQMIERGEQPTAEMEQELDRLLTEVQTNPTYQRVIVTNENFDKVMVQVNRSGFSTACERAPRVRSSRLDDRQEARNAHRLRRRRRLGEKHPAGTSRWAIHARRVFPFGTHREPGGTALGDEIRRLLLSPATTMGDAARKRCCSWHRARNSCSVELETAVLAAGNDRAARPVFSLGHMRIRSRAVGLSKAMCAPRT